MVEVGVGGVVGVGVGAGAVVVAALVVETG